MVRRPLLGPPAEGGLRGSPLWALPEPCPEKTLDRLPKTLTPEGSPGCRTVPGEGAPGAVREETALFSREGCSESGPSMREKLFPPWGDRGWGVTAPSPVVCNWPSQGSAPGELVPAFNPNGDAKGEMPAGPGLAPSPTPSEHPPTPATCPD